MDTVTTVTEDEEYTYKAIQPGVGGPVLARSPQVVRRWRSILRSPALPYIVYLVLWGPLYALTYWVAHVVLGW